MIIIIIALAEGEGGHKFGQIIILLQINVCMAKTRNMKQKLFPIENIKEQARHAKKQLIRFLYIGKTEISNFLYCRKRLTIPSK